MMNKIEKIEQLPDMVIVELLNEYRKILWDSDQFTEKVVDKKCFDLLGGSIYERRITDNPTLKKIIKDCLKRLGGSVI